MSIATPSEITEARANSFLLYTSSLLYEYNNIIAYKVSDETIVSATSEKITTVNGTKENNNHIVREFDLRVISTDKAEAELNAK